MAKVVSISVAVSALLLLFWASSGFGQTMAPSLSCDVFVDNMRVTFPPCYMEMKECRDLAKKLDRTDKTGAHITCKCQEGTRT